MGWNNSAHLSNRVVNPSFQQFSIRVPSIELWDVIIQESTCKWVNSILNKICCQHWLLNTQTFEYLFYLLSLMKSHHMHFWEMKLQLLYGCISLPAKTLCVGLRSWVNLRSKDQAYTLCKTRTMSHVRSVLPHVSHVPTLLVWHLHVHDLWNLVINQYMY